MSKQYMVVKFAKQLGSAAKGALEIVPMMGLLTEQAAEECVARLTEADPVSVYVIQEVGAA